MAAGLPACHWTFAVTCAAHLLNVEKVDGESAWEKMYDQEFRGEQLPFGATVFFKPSIARDNPFSDKLDPKAVPGVFAGYELGGGI